MAATESDIAAKLIERLLADPGFRDRFRRNPSAACREAGLDSLADEMAIGAGKAMHTLDMRESRSSLAGVVMAADGGHGAVQSRATSSQIQDLSGSIGDVLSRVNLPALPAADRSRAPRRRARRRCRRPTSPRGGTAAAGPRRRRCQTAGARHRPRRLRRLRTRRACGARGRREGARCARGRGGRPVARAAPRRPSSRGRAKAPRAAGAAAARSRPADGGGSQVPGGPASGVADAPAGAARGDPGGSALPTEQVEPKAATGGEPPDGKAAPQAAAAAPAAAQPAAPAARPRRARRTRDRGRAAPARAAAAGRGAAGRAGAGERAAIDADQFGQEGTGTGGKPDAEALAILKNKNIIFDSVGVADIKAGRIDPRIVAVLTKLSQEHKIVVSCMCSDHPR